MNELTEYAVYLLSRSKSPKHVVSGLLKRFGIGLTDKQVKLIAVEHAEEINQLADDELQQLKLGKKYGDIYLANPINQIQLHQAEAERYHYGHKEQRLSNRGTIEEVQVFDSRAVATHLKAIGEIVNRIESKDSVIDKHLQIEIIPVDEELNEIDNKATQITEESLLQQE